jgi:hypothetical protein
MGNILLPKSAKASQEFSYIAFKKLPKDVKQTSQLKAVLEYVHSQRQHHRTRSFQKELSRAIAEVPS